MAAIKKMVAILDFWYRKIKIQFRHIQKYKIGTTRIQIGQLSVVLFKNVYFDTHNGGHVEKWRKFDYKTFFSLQGVFLTILF